MKFTSILRASALALLVSLFVSCSSDNNNPVEQTTLQQHFDFSYAGTPHAVNNMTCVRTENYIEATGYTSDNYAIDIVFNKYGKLVSASTISTANGLESSFAYNKSQYFTFQMVSLDETNKIVEGTYSGRVYEDEYDFNSAYRTVSGSFKLRYTEASPNIPGLHFDAKINGQDWYGTFNSEGSEDLLFTDLFSGADDKYELVLRLPFETSLLSTGTFSFNQSSVYNKMVLNIFNPEVGYPTPAVINNGTLTISDITQFGNGYIVTGTFNFTATDPATNQTITITNGSLKVAYGN